MPVSMLLAMNQRLHCENESPLLNNRSGKLIAIRTTLKHTLFALDLFAVDSHVIFAHVLLEAGVVPVGFITVFDYALVLQEVSL